MREPPASPSPSPAAAAAAASPSPSSASASADAPFTADFAAAAHAGVKRAHRRTRCGHAEHQPSVEPAEAPQVYETPEMVAAVRRLQAPNQVYADNAAFVPIATAHAAGHTAPLRITVVWDTVLAGDPTGTTATYRQCAFAGQTIEAKNAAGNWASSATACDAASVVTAGSARLAAIQARTQSAMDFWAQTVKIKPVQDPIVLGSALCTEFGICVANTYSNTDLVMIMTARPSPASPIAGFAICYQRDQRGRCTVGQFNWVPNIINVAAPYDDQTIESEMHTALHELVHILGGMGPGTSVTSTPFLDPLLGTQLSSGVFLQQPDPAYGNPNKLQTLIITERVVNFTRTYYGCPNATGFPLEDLPLGMGVHWEARVAGPELMSYGSGSGQVFLSDLTLAFLEDTGQYIADYSRAGPIVNASLLTDDMRQLGSLAFLTTTGASSAGYVPPPPPPPGLQRYGAGQGCAFLTVAPAQSFSPAYACRQQKEYTCTPDNRMSAVCVVQNTWSIPGGDQFCGGYSQGNGGGSACWTNAGQANIASFERFFASDAAAAAATGVAGASAATTGGYNNANDYVPVPVGFWNCMYPSASANGTGGGESGNLLNKVSSLFGSAADMSSFGGQSRCPQCRCMKSSLMELDKGNIQTQYPSYGLCYRTNCYRPDYLQVAIMGAVPQITTGYSFWYACPAGGGKLYIPGYLGSLTCPDPVAFCAHETISGVLFPEQNYIMSAVFWGFITLLTLFGMGICACPCLRDPIILFAKGFCGVRVFEVPMVRDKNGNRPEPLPLKVAPARVLLAINLLALLAGLGVAVGSAMIVYNGGASAVTSVLCLGVLVAALGFVGIKAGTKVAEHGASCWLLTYFLANVCLDVLACWVVVYTFAFQDWPALVNSNYDRLAVFLPAGAFGCQNCTRAQGVAALTTLVEGNVNMVAGGIAALGLLFVTALFAAGSMIETKTLVAMFVVFANHVLTAFGLLMIIVGGYLATNKSVEAVPELIGLPVATGVFFIVLAVLGHCGVRNRSSAQLTAYAAMQLLLAALAVASAVACFTSQSRVEAALAKLSDADVGSIASSLGSSLSGAQVLARVQDSLDQLGLAFAILCGLQALLFAATLLLLRFLKAQALAALDAAGAALPPPAPAGAAKAGAAAKPIVIGKRSASGGAAAAGNVPAPAPAPAPLVIRRPVEPNAVARARAFAAASSSTVDI